MWPFHLSYRIGLPLNLLAICIILFYINRDHLLYSTGAAFLDNFNDAIQLIVNFASILAIFLESLHRRRECFTFFELVVRTEESFRKVMKVDVQKFYSESILRFTRDFHVLLWSAVAMELINAVEFGVDGEMTLYWLVNVFPLMLNRCRHLQYSYFLRMIVIQLQMVDDVLLRMVQVTSDGQESHPMALNNGQFLKGTNRRLKEFKDIHLMVLLQVKSFNRLFSYSLVLHLFQNFIEILCGCYWLYHYLLTNITVISGEFLFSLYN